MTKIAELKKKAPVLDRNQMKSLFGGVADVDCPDGQSAYYCNVSVDGGDSYGGYVCANSAQHAVNQTVTQLKHQGIDGGVVAC